jgi:hypothetical protein
VFVELIDHDCREIAHQKIAELWLEMPFDDRADVAHGGRRPTGSTPREPKIEELPDGHARTDRGREIGVRRQDLQLP